MTENLRNGLSVAIITYNEKDNIRQCLESISWVDEIIVVDSGSDDGTVDICKEYGVRFFTEPWQGFARQKNSAVEKTTRYWVLSLDADESITAELKEEIEATINLSVAKDGYYVARKNYFLGKWIKYCGWYPDYTLRLFKKGKGTFGEREVHESIDLTGSTGYLKNPMVHNTYKTISDYITRLDRYSTLAANELQKEKRKYGLWHIVLRPMYTFIHMYIIRLGFLEGYYGFILSLLYSFYTFAKYIKLRELQSKEK
jgi:glycosyltransferase involved in cell wall biosynthesis